MPDQVVILFMFAVLTSFGIVWLANELRLRYPARYLEYNFYFILSALCYGFANWIAPFVVLSLAEVAGASDPAWFVVIFVLIGVPILLIKLFFLYLLFQELLAPYIYFIIHGLPLLVLWLFHQNEPVVVLNTDAPNIIQFIEKHSLTPKEADILKQLIRGASNREIAGLSHISPNTVRNHIYNIYNKTGIRNRFQLLAICQADDKVLVD
jgi:DNA-binding CsgD family transcriptional regulator